MRISRLPRRQRGGITHPSDVAAASTTAGEHVDGNHADEQQEPGERSDPGPTSSGWTHGTDLLTRAVRVGIVVALICGPLALLAAAVSTGRPAPVTGRTTAPVDRTAEREAAAEYAEQVVGTWLATTSETADSLAALVSLPPSTSWPDEPSRGDQVAAADVSRARGGTWAVRVGATVSGPLAGGADTVRRYFRVPVVVDDGHLIATALPSPIAAPLPAPAPRLAYPDTVGTDDPAFATVRDFLAAMTTGGDIDRYLTPGVELEPITPAPYTGLDLVQLAAPQAVGDADVDGEQIAVLATAQIRQGQAGSVAQYALRLKARAGRWEVAGLDPAPRIDPDTEAGPVAPTSRPSGTTQPTNGADGPTPGEAP